MDFVWLIYCLGVFFGSRLILGTTGRSFWIQYLPWLCAMHPLKNFIVGFHESVEGWDYFYLQCTYTKCIHQSTNGWPSTNNGKSLQIFHLFIGFGTMIFTIHFGGFTNPPIFGETPICIPTVLPHIASCHESKNFGIPFNIWG